VTAFVLDASIAPAWCFADEATPAADALLDRLADEEAAAPALWRLEVANALTMAERRDRLSAKGTERAFHDLLDLARSERLTVYDAAYLELALHLGRSAGEQRY
jgi:predicted nucleic acid-binding protein